LFPICVTEQIRVAAATITKPCYHDVSTRALLILN